MKKILIIFVTCVLLLVSFNLAGCIEEPSDGIMDGNKLLGGDDKWGAGNIPITIDIAHKPSDPEEVSETTWKYSSKYRIRAYPKDTVPDYLDQNNDGAPDGAYFDDSFAQILVDESEPQACNGNLFSGEWRIGAQSVPLNLANNLRPQGDLYTDRTRIGDGNIGYRAFAELQSFANEFKASNIYIIVPIRFIIEVKNLRGDEVNQWEVDYPLIVHVMKPGEKLASDSKTNKDDDGYYHHKQDAVVKVVFPCKYALKNFVHVKTQGSYVQGSAWYTSTRSYDPFDDLPSWLILIPGVYITLWLVGKVYNALNWIGAGKDYSDFISESEAEFKDAEPYGEEKYIYEVIL